MWGVRGESHGIEGGLLVQIELILCSGFDIETVDQVVDAQGGQVGRFCVLAYVEEALGVDVDVDGAKKLVHIRL